MIRSYYKEDVGSLTHRMELDELLSDGGDTGEVSLECTRENEVDHHVSGIRERKKIEGLLGLEDFTLNRDEGGKVLEVK